MVNVSVSLDLLAIGVKTFVLRGILGKIVMRPADANLEIIFVTQLLVAYASLALMVGLNIQVLK